MTRGLIYQENVMPLIHMNITTELQGTMEQNISKLKV